MHLARPEACVLNPVDEIVDKLVVLVASEPSLKSTNFLELVIELYRLSTEIIELA